MSEDDLLPPPQWKELEQILASKPELRALPEKSRTSSVSFLPIECPSSHGKNQADQTLSQSQEEVKTISSVPKLKKLTEIVKSPRFFSTKGSGDVIKDDSLPPTPKSPKFAEHSKGKVLQDTDNPKLNLLSTVSAHTLSEVKNDQPAIPKTSSYHSIRQRDSSWLTKSKSRDCEYDIYKTGQQQEYCNERHRVHFAQETKDKKNFAHKHFFQDVLSVAEAQREIRMLEEYVEKQEAEMQMEEEKAKREREICEEKIKNRQSRQSENYGKEDAGNYDNESKCRQSQMTANECSCHGFVLNRLAEFETKISREESSSTRIEEIENKIQQLQEAFDEIVRNEKSPNKASSALKQQEDSGSNEEMKNLQLQCQKLQKRVTEMETFLADYGLEWVGCGSAVASDASSDKSTPKKRYKEGLMPDFDLLSTRIDELNMIAGSGQPQLCKTSQGASFTMLLKGLDLTIYKNGITLDEGPFRPYSDPITQLLLLDITDGYFPSELKTKYPDGVPFKLVDKRDELYQPRSPLRAFSGQGFRLGGRRRNSRLVNEYYKQRRRLSHCQIKARDQQKFAYCNQLMSRESFELMSNRDDQKIVECTGSQGCSMFCGSREQRKNRCRSTSRERSKECLSLQKSKDNLDHCLKMDKSPDYLQASDFTRIKSRNQLSNLEHGDFNQSANLWIPFVGEEMILTKKPSRPSISNNDLVLEESSANKTGCDRATSPANIDWFYPLQMPFTYKESSRKLPAEINSPSDGQETHCYNLNCITEPHFRSSTCSPKQCHTMSCPPKTHCQSLSCLPKAQGHNLNCTSKIHYQSLSSPRTNQCKSLASFTESKVNTSRWSAPTVSQRVESILSKLPKTVVKDGKLIDVRKSVQELIETQQQCNDVVRKQVDLKVRLPDGIIKIQMDAGCTLSELKSRIQEAIGTDSDVKLTCSYTRKVLGNDLATLAQYGLHPNSVLYLNVS